MVSARFVLRGYFCRRRTGKRFESPTFLSCKTLCVTEEQMNHTQEIQDLFDILHDGYIDAYRETSGYVEFKIGIQYLAELFHEGGEVLYLEIQDLEYLNFTPWSEDHSAITDIETIVNLELGILNCDYQNNGFHIHCSCDETQHGFTGGTLTVNFRKFNVKDETGKTITLNNLRKVANKYWDELD